MTPGMWVRRDGGEVLQLQGLSSAWHQKMLHSRLQRQGNSKGKSKARKGRWCQLGERDRKDLPGVKVTGWCGSHLCTSVTDQAAREVGVSMGMALGSCWAVLGRTLDTPRVCFLGADEV